MDSDAELRFAAVSLVAEYWPFNELFAAPCLRLAFDDPDSRIRGAATASLRYKLSSFVEDPSGQFRKLLNFLMDLEPVARELALGVRKELSDTLEWAHDEGLRELSQLAGEHLAEISRSVRTAASYLDHPSADLRRAALMVLYRRWRSVYDIRESCIRLIRNDPDLDVRLEAQSILTAAFSRSDDVEVGRFLASTVRDASEPTSLRRDAYLGLFVVRPMPVGRVLEVSSATFRFPEDVDWAFVNSFY